MCVCVCACLCIPLCIYFIACGRAALPTIFFAKTRRGAVSAAASAAAALAFAAGFAMPTAATRCPANVLRSRIFSRLHREKQFFSSLLLMLLLLLALPANTCMHAHSYSHTHLLTDTPIQRHIHTDIAR